LIDNSTEVKKLPTITTPDSVQDSSFSSVKSSNLINYINIAPIKKGNGLDTVIQLKPETITPRSVELKNPYPSPKYNSIRSGERRLSAMIPPNTLNQDIHVIDEESLKRNQDLKPILT